ETLTKLEALAVYTLAELDAPRAVRVGNQTLLICLNRQGEALDVFLLDDLLMRRLERQNLLQGDVPGAQCLCLGAAKAAGNKCLELADRAVRLVLVVQFEDLAEQGVVGFAVRYMVGAAEREGHAVYGSAAGLQERDACEQGSGNELAEVFHAGF